MTDRFAIPVVGDPSAVTFPPVRRVVFDNGLPVWSIREASAPVVTILLMLDAGTSRDPANRPGLSSLVASLAAESAGARDSLALADALARLGARLEVLPGADVTTVSLSTLARHMDAALDLLADIVRRPQLNEDDFARVRDLRIGRLRQASRVAATIADRALIGAVFGDHPYGHGALGTSAAVEATSVDDVRAFWRSHWRGAGATLIAAGDVDALAFQRAAARAFDGWDPGTPPATLHEPATTATTSVVVVDRPGAAQAELRVGHVGPARNTPRYHELLTLNALLGGQFTSRINRNLRESRAITYGARTSLDMRRAGGLISCDTSVQADAAATGVLEILREFREVMGVRPIESAETARAQASLTRGYVRNFETAAHLARALGELATYGLGDDTFDRFVPAINALRAEDLMAVARTALRPEEAAIVVVTDLSHHGATLEAIGRPLAQTTVEF